MDQQQERQINEAAEKFADAVKESYQAVAGRTISAQELNAELTQNFFNGVIHNLRSQVESSQKLTQQLADQQSRQREATQALTRESVNAYMEFVNSMFSYCQGNIEQAQERAELSRKSAAREPTLSEYVGLGGLEEEEAQALALELVRRARREAPEREIEGPALSAKEVRERLLSRTRGS